MTVYNTPVNDQPRSARARPSSCRTPGRSRDASDAQRRRALRAPHRQPRTSSRRRPVSSCGARTFEAQPDSSSGTTSCRGCRVAYDVTGSGRTVLKASVSQFTQRQGAALIDQFNPLRQNTEVRTWTDANGDLIPQLDEIGPGQGALDRGATVRIADDLRRPTQWEATASVEQQLADNLAVTVSYFRRRYQRPHRGRERRARAGRLHTARASPIRSTARRSRSTTRARPASAGSTTC